VPTSRAQSQPSFKMINITKVSFGTCWKQILNSRPTAKRNASKANVVFVSVCISRHRKKYSSLRNQLRKQTVCVSLWLKNCRTMCLRQEKSCCAQTENTYLADLNKEGNQRRIYDINFSIFFCCFSVKLAALACNT